MSRSLWAQRGASMPRAPVDVSDGFVHLSSAAQVEETAAKHFAGQTELLLLDVDETRLVPGTLRWEPSRGGALFPHVYGEVPVTAVVQERALPWKGEAFDFPPL